MGIGILVGYRFSLSLLVWFCTLLLGQGCKGVKLLHFIYMAIIGKMVRTRKGQMNAREWYESSSAEFIETNQFANSNRGSPRVGRVGEDVKYQEFEPWIAR